MSLKNWRDIIGGLAVILLIGALYGSFGTLGFTIGSGAEVFGANIFNGLLWVGSIWFLYRKLVKKV